MTLIARDCEPPLARGRGTFEIGASGAFSYRMVAMPDDLKHALTVINRQKSNPYEHIYRFRIKFVDEDGREWNGGWTVPTIDMGSQSWTFSGTSDGMVSTFESDPTPVGSSRVHLRVPHGYGASALFHRSLSSGGLPGSSSSRIVLVGETPVTFGFDGSSNILSISAPIGKDLPSAHGENWLVEPLRILFGQPIYPWLVERRLPDRTQFWVRCGYDWSRTTGFLSLWSGGLDPNAIDDFYRTYEVLLRMIASHGDWEANKITELFDQNNDAAQGGSRWVLAMTLSSSVEGLTRILVPRDSLRPDADKEAIENLQEHIKQWKGEERLRSIAIEAVGRADNVSPYRGLRALASQQKCTLAHVESWNSVRNRVMHGELISPYSSVEEDQIIFDLAQLLKDLTMEIIARSRA